MKRLIVLGLVGCTGKGTSTADSAGQLDERPTADVVFAALGKDVILPQYAAFAAAAVVASDAAGTFCADPSASTLAAAQDGWVGLRAPWLAQEVVRFGPYREQPWRVGPAIDTWPLDEGVLQEVLDDGAPIDIDTFGSTRKGMHTAEFLLWSGGDDTLDLFAADARRCDWLVAVSAAVAAQAAVIHGAWDPAGDDWLAQLVSPGTVAPTGMTNPAFADSAAVLSEYANRAIFAAEDTRLVRLSAPLGELDGVPPRPELVESPWAGRSVQDARDVLLGVKRHVLGDGGPGLSALLPPDDRAELEQSFTDAWTAADGALAAIVDPLGPSLTTDPVPVRRAIEAVKDLQVVLQVELAQAWQITVQFNDNDGD